jgi:GT2 family glycosyltransferase
MNRVFKSSWSRAIRPLKRFLENRFPNKLSIPEFIEELESFQFSSIFVRISRLAQRLLKSTFHSIKFELGIDFSIFRYKQVSSKFTPADSLQIGVCVVSFGTNKYLIDSLVSITNQTVQPNEVVLILSGTANEIEFSVELLNKNQTKLPNMSYLIVEPKSAAENRNIGAQHLTTDYIVFLDGDDILKRKAIELFKYSARKGLASVVGSSCEVFPKFGIYRVLTKVAKQDLAKSNQLNVTSLIKREVFLRIGGFRESAIPNEHLPEDWDLWFRFSSSGQAIQNIQDPLFRYRQHPGSTSSKTNWLYGEKTEFWKYAVTSGENIYWRQFYSQPNGLTPIKRMSENASLGALDEFGLILADNLTEDASILHEKVNGSKIYQKLIVLENTLEEICQFEELYYPNLCVYSLKYSFLDSEGAVVFLQENFVGAKENILILPNTVKLEKYMKRIQRKSA